MSSRFGENGTLMYNVFIEYLERLTEGGEFDTDSLCGDEYHKLVFARSILGFVDGALSSLEREDAGKVLINPSWNRRRDENRDNSAVIEYGRQRLLVVRAAVQRRLNEHCVHLVTAALGARNAGSAKGKEKA